MTDVNLLLLSSEERIFYRDRLRAARYSALADAEGFQQTCYALEALGRRLLGQEAALDKYKDPIREIAMTAPSLSSLPVSHPMFFTRFDACSCAANLHSCALANLTIQTSHQVKLECCGAFHYI